jgi:hypothetical protein
MLLTSYILEQAFFILFLTLNKSVIGDTLDLSLAWSDA